ncbi:hypothetical protein MTAT_18990 [Moorella thermoacetica]|uniref:Uncharacterized protein n=1 Tax=Neomoorella thermoacetica TaxID=1525 RepID=A0AAC9MVE9_NEOTH|nr:hypothetical protein [Moorella thermoacetica]AOQ24556.1 hypothetical protein Maut_02126 [Moorella thermoacetica]TYL12657.1 hypothetical protein MTAT_18990 [Moorella thermoacetica]
MRITIRLNDKEDQDIIQHLNNVKNISKEVRRLLRVGLGVPVGIQPSREPVVAKTKPTILPKVEQKQIAAEDILDNLLGNF